MSEEKYQKGAYTNDIPLICMNVYIHIHKIYYSHERSQRDTKEQQSRYFVLFVLLYEHGQRTGMIYAC